MSLYRKKTSYIYNLITLYTCLYIDACRHYNSTYCSKDVLNAEKTESDNANLDDLSCSSADSSLVSLGTMSLPLRCCFD